jgi:hypothetical protein
VRGRALAEAARQRGDGDRSQSQYPRCADEIVALAGTRKVPELTTRLADDGLTGERTVRMEQRLTIDPNKVRSLEPGAAYLINHGKAMKIQVPRAPALRAPLPEPGDPAEINTLQSVPFAGISAEKGLDLPL